ncbi:hypothetical protein Gogos_012011, partial [Gossypium gossypioides]|nr:hypothetical protein [Gossypium gossypioides]
MRDTRSYNRAFSIGHSELVVEPFEWEYTGEHWELATHDLNDFVEPFESVVQQVIETNPDSSCSSLTNGDGEDENGDSEGGDE